MAAKTSTPDLAAEIAALYVLPPAEFIPGRNALAVRLRKEGDRDAAERVKNLAKPSLSAWAVNLLVRDEREKMDALLAAGAGARSALGQAVDRGAAGSWRSALGDQRKLRDDLRRRAVALLTQAGTAPGRAIVDRITANLDALATNPAAAEAAERGWLDLDLDPPGFEALAGLQLGAVPERPEHHGLRLVPSPPAAKESPADARRRQREEAARERRARAEEKVTNSAAKAEALGAEADKAETAAVEAERSAEEARRSAQAARRNADQARSRAETAAEHLAQAREELEAAQVID
jgi:hypothetical protein